MTYENFKKELYCDVQETEAAQGRTVRLLEQHMVSSDPVTVHMINMINRSIYGSDIIPAREDRRRGGLMAGRESQIYCLQEAYDRSPHEL